jgi:ubiquinone biosynthesis protein
MLKRFIKTGTFLNDIKTRFATPQKIVRKTDAEWLKTSLQDMGVSYVKIGQFISSRKDLFDTNIVDALRDLQDNVQPMNEDDVYNTMITHLELCKFESISMKPEASASIGQVHRAKLKTGEQVVIKVKRPNIENILESDMFIIFTLLSVMEKFGALNISETREICNDFRDFVIQETDYMNEMKNIKLFHSLNEETPDIIVPKLYEELSNEHMIVMEYVPSYKIEAIKSQLNMQQRSQLAYQLMDAIITQFITNGVIHGDPHEGNIGVSRDAKGSHLVLYDLGHIIKINDQTRAMFKQFIFEIMIENVEGAMEVLKRIDLVQIRNETKLKDYLKQYIKYVKTIDYRVFKDMEANNNDELIPVKFDGIIFRLIRVFGLIEGICKDLDPDFNYNTVFARYVDKLIFDPGFLAYKVKADIKSILNMVLRNIG